MELQRLSWRKSSRSSGGGNGDCVEVAATAEMTAVRDSQYPDDHVLVFKTAAWTAFLTAVRAGQLTFARSGN